MMFWKKKKKESECEHQWTYIPKELLYIHDYEVYCPRCDTSKFFRYKDNALACAKKSELRHQFLKEQEARRLSNEHTGASGSDQL